MGALLGDAPQTFAGRSVPLNLVLTKGGRLLLVEPRHVRSVDVEDSSLLPPTAVAIQLKVTPTPLRAGAARPKVVARRERRLGGGGGGGRGGGRAAPVYPESDACGDGGSDDDEEEENVVKRRRKGREGR